VNENKRKITVKIAEKPYELWIEKTSDEEELARNAAAIVSNKNARCRSKYGKSTERDLLAMVAFKLSKENLLIKRQNDTAPYIEKIRQMTEEIKLCLKKNRTE
jgi:cell division protein ZapA